MNTKTLLQKKKKKTKKKRKTYNNLSRAKFRKLTKIS